MFDMAGKYKWDAWKKNEGKAKEAAQSEYVDYFFTVSLTRTTSSGTDWPLTAV
jgi:acyl-CoA-binding protein